MYRTSRRMSWFGFIALFIAAVPVYILFSSTPCSAQYQPGSYGAKLQQNLAEQNNLKGNINLLLKLREQAKYQANLARAGGDRPAFDHWKGQYNGLQQRIKQYRQKLRHLQVQEHQLRGAAQAYGPNAIAGTSGRSLGPGSGSGGTSGGGYGSGSGGGYGGGYGSGGQGGGSGGKPISGGKPAGGGSGGSGGGDCKGVNLLGNCAQ